MRWIQPTIIIVTLAMVGFVGGLYFLFQTFYHDARENLYCRVATAFHGSFRLFVVELMTNRTFPDKSQP